MKAHGHPGWWSWLTVIAGCLASMLVSITVAISVNNQSLERDRQERAIAERVERDRLAKSRAASCAFIHKINKAYQDQIHELSGPGLTIAAAWADLAKECP